MPAGHKAMIKERNEVCIPMLLGVLASGKVKLQPAGCLGEWEVELAVIIIKSYMLHGVTCCWKCQFSPLCHTGGTCLFPLSPKELAVTAVHIGNS